MKNRDIRMRSRATKEELFKEDPFSVSWGTHQIWRIQRLMELKSSALSIPVESLRLSFVDKSPVRLINRKSKEALYYPQGIIDQIDIPEDETESLLFDVRWVDPWGYAYQDTRSFLEIRFQIMDQFSFARMRKTIEQAYERNKVSTK